MLIEPTAEQRAIIEHSGGHARVLAVAGSGKTFTMGQRIAYLVNEKQVNPNRIRALMFNRLAKEQFVDRLLQLGFHDKGLPYVTTFHGFAYQFVNYLIKQNRFPKKRFWIGEEEERGRLLLHKVIRSLRKEGDLPPANAPEGSFDIEEVMETIGLYKGALIPPGRAGHRFNEFIPVIYKKYEEERVKANAMTFDDFIPTVIYALENDATLKAQWSAKLDYLIVDEYQDVNYGQQRLVEILAGDRAEVMVVGDDDQTIYEWRGARPNYILRDFMTEFSNKPHTTYRLSYSFRFGPIIAQAAQNSIIHNTNRESKDIIAFDQKRQSDIFLLPGRPESMSIIYREMAQEIIRLVKRQGIRPSEIWVLGRMYSQLVGLEMTLLTLKVPYKVLGGKPFYERSEIRKLMNYLKVSISLDQPIKKGSGKDFLSILNYPNRKISNSSFQTVIERAIAQNSTWNDLFTWLLGNDGQSSMEFSGNQFNALKELIDLLRITQRGMGNPVGVLLKRIVEVSGLEAHFDNYYGQREASLERKSMIEGFLAFASNLKLPVAEFTEYLRKLDPTRGAPNEQLIILSTVHKTKGLEFEYIFIPACIEGFMPCLISSPTTIFDKKNPGRESEASLNIENERRLFYVALTRAKKAAYIATIIPDNKQNGLLPSRFLDEILLDECFSTLKGLSEAGNWSAQKRELWLAELKKVAGRKGLLDNIEKYLLKLGVDALRQRVAAIKAGASSMPFSYKHAYKNLEGISDITDNKEPPEINFWSDVLEQ